MPNVVNAAGRAEPTYPITSVGNALRLLLLFRERKAIRLSDASDYLGVANSTAHRLLAMLVHHEFVEQDPGQRTYIAGPALVEIGLAAVRGMDLRTSARPVLEELAARSGETALLSRLEGDTVVCLDSIESKKALRVVTQAQLTLPAHCTASGKALLAVLPREEFRGLYPPRVRLPGPTMKTIRNRAELERALDEVRDRGFATSEEESEEGLTSIAAVVHDARGRVVAALSVSGPVSRIDARRRARHIDEVVEAAQHLTQVFIDESIPSG